MDQYENPLDLWMVRNSGWLIRWLHESLGLSPNAVTLLSMVLSIVGMIFLWRGGTVGFLGFVISTALSYWLDDLDGAMARRYKLTSDIGEILDHTSDALGFVGVVAVLAIRYKAFSKAPFLMAMLLLSSLFPMLHYGCASRMCGSEPKGVVGILMALCPSSATASKCTANLLKSFGGGTYQLFFIALSLTIASICSTPKVWSAPVWAAG